MSNAGDKPVVTQRARDAAPFVTGHGYIEGYSYSMEHMARIGKADDNELVQAFACFEQDTLSREGREDDKPPSHWKPDERYADRQPMTPEEWDWRADSHDNGPLERSIKRLNYAADRADPHAPDQMATVLRIDLMRVLSQVVWLTARCNMLKDKVAALSPPASEGRDVGREALRHEIINTPETADFMAGVPLEAAHQRERWGSSHDAGKTPFDWFWLIGYLAQKAASAAVADDMEKAKHHAISTAAALANWHAALSGADTSMRPGIAPPDAASKHRKDRAMASSFNFADRCAIYWRTWRCRGVAKMDHRLWLHWAIFGRYPL